MSAPVVSILIPCRDAARWLSATLESAVGQIGVATEIVVVDDGSTDESRDLVQSWASRGVRLLTQSSLGASAARNHALAQSRAPWVQFLDADDLLGPEKIIRQLHTLTTAPAGTVASASWGRFAHEATPASAVFADSAVERDYSPATEFLLQQAETGSMMHPAAWLCPRSLLDQAGPWNERLSLNDDGEYFTRVLCRSSGIRYVSDARTFYRSGRSGSLSQTRRQDALKSLHDSVALSVAELLAKADSPRARQAVAELWERTRFELYPEASALSADAARQARTRGRPRTLLPCGPRLRWLVTLGGWKLARRLQVRIRRA